MKNYFIDQEDAILTQPKIPVDLIIKSLAEEAESAQKRMGKAADVLLGELNTDIATTPYDVVYQQDRVKLKHYKPIKKKKVKTPLLLIYALINRETMLDLSPGRSVVENFLQQGVDIYMVDWGYPTRKDRYLGIDDHVNVYINDIVDFICKRENLPKINHHGHLHGRYIQRHLCSHASGKGSESDHHGYAHLIQYRYRLTEYLDAQGTR